MSDSFVSRGQKDKSSGTKITMVQTYSKDAGFQLTLNRTDYKDGSHDMSCSIEMCQGHSEKNESGKGFKTVCNWKEEKIVISLNTDELALFSKFADSYFVRRLGMPKPTYDMKTGKAVENNGRPVYETDKQGNVVVYGENIYHTFNGKPSILKLFKNKMNPMGIGISLSKECKTVTMYMDENVTRKFAKCCEFAMERMVMDDSYTFKYNTSSAGYSQNNNYQRKSPDQMPQPNSYRDSYREPRASSVDDDYPDLPPVDIDSLSSPDDDNIPF